jgi:hypothetical protein
MAKLKDACMILTGPIPPPVKGSQYSDDFPIEPVGAYRAKLWTVPESGGEEVEVDILFGEFMDEEGIQAVITFLPANEDSEEIVEFILKLENNENVSLPVEEERMIFMYSDLLQFACDFIETDDVPVEETIYWSDIEEDDEEEEEEDDSW